MHVLIALVIAALATWGLKRLWDRAHAAGRQRIEAARTRLADWRAAQANRPAPAPSPLAIKTGVIAGGVVQGVALAWGAGVPGWRLGWAVGRERVRDWWARRQQEQIEQPAPQPDPPAAEPEPAAPEPPPPVALDPTYPPTLRLVRNPATEPQGGGEVPVIEPLGEINTIADVRAAVQRIINQYTAEVDDAAAEAARKKDSYDAALSLAEQATRVLDRDPIGRVAVTSLVEPARQAWLLAQARKANCDQMLAQAQSALYALNQHRSMEEAAAATPQASSRTETYQPQ